MVPLFAEVKPEASGNLIEKGKFSGNQIKTGLWQTFTEAGNLIQETDYLDGKKNGLEKIYNLQGKLISQFQFKQGQKNGVIKLFDDSGKPTEEYTTQNGTYDKQYKKFFPSGNIKTIDTYKQGKLDGVSKEYLENGKLVKFKVYLNNAIKVDRSYDPKSNKLKSEKLYIFVNPEKYLMKIYNEKGFTEIEKIELSGKKDGFYLKQNSEPGKIMKEEFYVENFKELEIYYSQESPDPTKVLDLGL
jgi:antitoxin component YwqK of YwqJK toxin-antitoxin module